ncbi:hypothetical protein KHA94_19530 [Bacillus sp. FJAT-49705]|uniref:Uncharacterized protein n=1 Tax=Cytobacillus citreus TaxID=2833586 RepID=A0ABS5NWY9_9BACI|nr:hypothetical protein [Cytobacillus citreus]
MSLLEKCRTNQVFRQNPGGDRHYFSAVGKRRNRPCVSMMDAGLDLETKCLQRKNGKVMVTDGPFVETKELIGSVFLIEAKHQNIQGRGLQ